MNSQSNAGPVKLALINLTYFPGFPPLGLCSLATYLKANLDTVQTVIIDINFDDLHEKLAEIKPDIIGLSVMSIYYPTAIQVAKQIRAQSNAAIIIGGPHITTLPDSLQPCFDAGVVGEGEDTLTELITCFEATRQFRSQDLTQIKGLVFFENDQLNRTEPRPLIEPLDKIPIPDRRYLNSRYFNDAGTPSTSSQCFRILTARGCPFQCAFCSSRVMWGKRVRFHSIERIAEEIRLGLSEYNSSVIHFIDDLFPGSKDRLRHLIQETKRLVPDRRFTFQISTRASTIDDEMIHLLKQLGDPMIYIGYESGNSGMLRFLKGKNADVQDSYNALRMLEKHGIPHGGSFILGSPGESLDQMMDTVNLIRYAYRKKARYFFIFSMIPLPGTKIWEMARERGVVTNDMDWEQLTLFPGNGLGSTAPIMLDPGIKLKDFNQILNKANRYPRRSHLKKILAKFKRKPVRTVYRILRHPKQLQMNRSFLDNLKTGLDRIPEESTNQQRG